MGSSYLSGYTQVKHFPAYLPGYILYISLGQVYSPWQSQPNTSVPVTDSVAAEKTSKVSDAGQEDILESDKPKLAIPNALTSVLPYSTIYMNFQFLRCKCFRRIAMENSIQFVSKFMEIC